MTNKQILLECLKLLPLSLFWAALVYIFFALAFLII